MIVTKYESKILREILSIGENHDDTYLNNNRMCN